MASIQKSLMIKNSSLLHIKNLAESIALEFSEVVTPLDKIIEEEGLELFYDSYGDTFDGMTIYDSPHFFIHANTFRGNKLGTTRARFTIAHELGHYFLDNHRLGLMRGLLVPHISRNNEEAHAKIEREADYFASCLLMPESQFKAFVQRKKFDIQLLKAIADYFQVSLTAAAIRFSAIGNHSLMIVFGYKGKIKWKWCSDDFQYPYLLYTEKVPENSLMGEYFFEHKISKDTEKVWAIDWFSYVKDYDASKQFNEYCMAHKDFALSIIWQ